MVAAIKEGVKWLIVGGDGQLGHALQKELSDSGVRFDSLSRMNLDITIESEVQSVLEKYKPDVVVNAAAWTNVDAAETSEENARNCNALGPLYLARECSKSHTKLVHISTDYVFSGKSCIPWAENAVLNPISAYGRTKAEGEKLVLRNNPGGSYIVRTAWLYGAWGRNFAKTMLKIALLDTKSVEVVNDQIGQPTFTADLSNQIIRLIAAGTPPGIFHGTNSGKASWFEFAQEIFALAGADPDRVRPVNSTSQQRQAVRPVYSVLGHDHWSEVGIAPMRPWREALKEAMPRILNSMNLKE